jgi:hypothetical protein
VCCRYDLAPPVMRPSVKTTAEQQAACGALIAIGRSHPEVFSAVVGECQCAVQHSIHACVLFLIWSTSS